MGKLGKPQKSKKHKKMKKTFDSNPDDVDLPVGGKRTKLHNLPVNDEDLDKQEIPRKVKEIMENRTKFQTIGKQSKNKVKKNKFKKAVDATVKMERGVSKPMQSIPKFVQGKREKDRDFIRRIELETHKFVMKTQMEEKLKLDVPEDSSKTSSSSQGLTKTSQRKKEKDKERKKKKMQAVKEKKLEKERDFSLLKDEVAFGEVAMAPPSLTARPRKVQVDSEKARPGKRSLLLKEMMETSSGKSTRKQSGNPADNFNRIKPKSQAQRQAGQTLKRKYLSPVQKQITDFQRQKAIDLYRKMKDQKIKDPR